ncbi:cysteine hydrolase family protein [Undibacterium sp.]|jgi:nicotinamidase-related amidase|uniref:cysteine hydrolase family protein n=1 Tax=Undibacterium sp. TaxID=1914977 RepID=UPI002CF3608C|nr:cysteine hydrolase family protein [Undibacterium sp.]HTD05709.1 cysteine hydrolase family protein [Undibacterium sp.]
MSASDTNKAVATPKRALVVIDAQNEYFSGDLLIEYPDPQVSIRNIGLAMDAARAAGIPVLVVQHTAPAGAPIFQKGKPAWELHDTVKSRRHDHHIEKNMPSIFTGTDAAAWLKKNGIDTLAITGYMTQNCNASTIYQAMHDGYQVEMLSDATGAVPYVNAAGSATAEEVHRVLSVIFHSNFAAVARTADWIKAINAGDVIAKSNVPASNKAARALKAA